jgi:hypothetical protein
MKISDMWASIIMEIYFTVIYLSFALSGVFLSLGFIFDISILIFSGLCTLFIGWIYSMLIIELINKYHVKSILHKKISKDFKR